MPTFSCAAILFDLDGVLADSTEAVEREWREWAARKGVDGDAVMAIAHGVRTVEVIRRVAPHLDAEAEAAAIENHEAHDQRGVVVMPGAADLVRSIPEGRWGVVTSGSRELASNRLRHCGLPVPEVLVTSDDVVNGKPHPEPYLKGAERLGFAPAECLVIEDAPAGIQSARAGGMKVVGLASTYRADALAHADAVIGKLGQLRVTSDEAARLVVSVRRGEEVNRTEQRLSLEPFPPGFPPELTAQAFVHTGEAAWRPELATGAVKWLGEHGYAVLGTELLRPGQDGIQSLPYFQSVDRKDNEDWTSFVTRAASETIDYLKRFAREFAKEGDVYINLTWVSESEFRALRSR